MRYLGAVIYLIKYFKGFKIEQINRVKNSHSDELASLASACKALEYRTITLGSIERPTYEIEDKEVHNINLGPSWIDEIVAFLKKKWNSTERQKWKCFASGTKQLTIGFQKTRLRPLLTSS